jgi:hypothetical protein
MVRGQVIEDTNAVGTFAYEQFVICGVDGDCQPLFAIPAVDVFAGKTALDTVILLLASLSVFPGRIFGIIIFTQLCNFSCQFTP